MTVQGDGHVLNVRMLRFWNRPHREEAAMLAQALLTGGRIDEALGVTEEALGQDPTDADLLLVRGRAWLLGGDLARAQRLFMRAAQREPGWAEPWRCLGEVLVARGRYSKALEVLDRAQAITPDDPGSDALRRRASLMIAIEARLARFTADPATEDATLLAQDLIDLDRPADASKVIEVALAEDPGFVLPEANDTAVGFPAPVGEPKAWALDRGRPRSRLRASAGRAYLPPPPSRLSPAGPGWE